MEIRKISTKRIWHLHTIYETTYNLKQTKRRMLFPSLTREINNTQYSLKQNVNLLLHDASILRHLILQKNTFLFFVSQQHVFKDYNINIMKPNLLLFIFTRIMLLSFKIDLIHSCNINLLIIKPLLSGNLTPSKFIKP